MSRKYKMHNPEGIYFVSFATINWIDVFVREDYLNIIAESLNYCSRNKTMVLYAYCIMPSHVHLIFADQAQKLSKLLKEFKTHTSKQLRAAIEDNPKESRKEWMLWMMKRAGAKNSNVQEYQFWQQHNQPIELWSHEVINQKLKYVHHNPVEAGLVNEPEHWKYSSAMDYSGGKGLVHVEFIS